MRFSPGKVLEKSLDLIHQNMWEPCFYYRLVSDIRCTSNIRRTPTLGNSQLKFSPTISLAKSSNTRRTLSFDPWVSVVDKVWSRPTWSELLCVAWDFDSPWIKGPMTPYQSRPHVRHIAVIPAAKLWDSIAIVSVYKTRRNEHWSVQTSGLQRALVRSKSHWSVMVRAASSKRGTPRI